MGDITAKILAKVLMAFLKKEKNSLGKKWDLHAGQLTGEEMASELSKALGQPVIYNKIPASVYRSFGFPGADNFYSVTCFSSMMILKNR